MMSLQPYLQPIRSHKPPRWRFTCFAISPSVARVGLKSYSLLPPPVPRPSPPPLPPPPPPPLPRACDVHLGFGARPERTPAGHLWQGTPVSFSAPLPRCQAPFDPPTMPAKRSRGRVKKIPVVARALEQRLPKYCAFVPQNCFPDAKFNFTIDFCYFLVCFST
jgi:U5 snRNP spliceosome subunit